MANSTIGGIVNIKITKVPKIAFGDWIANILEGCEMIIVTGEEDSSSYLHDKNRRLGDIDHVELPYLDIVTSVKKRHGEDTGREFTRRYVNMFGLLSLSKPLILNTSCIEIV